MAGSNICPVTALRLLLATVSFCSAVKLSLDSSNCQRSSRHAAASKNHDMLNFLVLADWGGAERTPYYTHIEATVACQMGLTADAVKSRFTVALGDNFYKNGVKDVNDKRFNETYEAVFAATSLDTPWYFIAGNHDHNGNVSAQILYTDIKKRWNFPDYYYNLKFAAGDGATVEIILIDTSLLCGNKHSDACYDPVELSKDPTAMKTAEKQWQWINKTLAASRADYIIVGGHYPVYSVAKHGSTDCLVKRLQPLLHQYRVQTYICGHDHNLQHIRVNAKNSTTDYFVVGAANYMEHSNSHNHTVPSGSLKYFWPKITKAERGGFGMIQMNKDAMTFSFIDALNGQSLYGTTMHPVDRRGKS